MTREERLQAIHDTFRDCAERFCTETQGIYIEIQPTYRGEECAEALRALSATVTYRAFEIELRYTAHASLNVISSVLECYVILGKGEDAIPVPLPMLLSYCGIDEATPVCIPMITTPKGMREAFDHVGAVLCSLLPTIERLSDDPARKSEVLQRFFEEINLHLNLKLPSPVTLDGEHAIRPYLNDGLYAFFTLRFCSTPFLNLLQGKREKAIKGLRKIKKRMEYEERMLRLWETEGTQAKSLPAARGATSMLDNSGQPKTSGKEFFALFLSWILLTIPFSLVYVGGFSLLALFEGRDAVHLIGVWSSIPYSILFAFLSSIAASYFLRFFIYRMLFPKRYEEYRAADQVHNGAGGDKLIRGLLAIIVAAAIVGSVLFVKHNLKFCEDGFIDNTEFFSLSGEYHPYSDVARIYYRADRVNPLGETIPYPSWVLVLSDGREIDLYELEDIEAYENTLIPFLEEKINP